MPLYDDAMKICQAALQSALPDNAVKKALAGMDLDQAHKVILVAIGKAAWQMASAASQALGPRIDGGVVITKHGHSLGDLPGLVVFEAGHPVPDEHSLKATQAALAAVRGLEPRDVVLFLVSGGGSALFEDPVVGLDELQDITQQLLAAGCDIVAVNTVRKRLSRVKGGRFAQACLPASVQAIVLSDIIGDPLDMIASGPAYPDASTYEQAQRIILRHGISLSKQAQEALMEETPKALSNVRTQITGSVSQLCQAAASTARELGYAPQILTASLRCEAREAGSFLASLAEYHQGSQRSLAFILGGETIVKLKGRGKGGRNQEMALAAAAVLATCQRTCLFSLGSDGTDGPTDAAGGYVDQDSLCKMKAEGIDPMAHLDNNDAYPALKAIDGLIMTGPTGTNVNDVSVLLIKR